MFDSFYNCRIVTLEFVICDVGAIKRNLEFIRNHNIRGTPALVFADGSRASGAMGVVALERRFRNVKL